MRSVLAMVLFVLASVACEGPVGPTGPQGPQGEPGDTQRLIANGTIPTGGMVFHELPAGLGSADDLPVVTCYLSPDGVVWFGVLDGYTETAPYCTIEVVTGGIGVRLTQAPVTWSYFIAVVY